MILLSTRCEASEHDPEATPPYFPISPLARGGGGACASCPLFFTGADNNKGGDTQHGTVLLTWSYL